LLAVPGAASVIPSDPHQPEINPDGAGLANANDRDQHDTRGRNDGRANLRSS
jgi:hypothetical protein